MSDFKVIDKDGTWYTNTGDFPLPDYQRQSDTPGSELILIQPGVPTKLKASAYLLGQPMLQTLTHDPITGDEIKVKTPAPTKVDTPKAPA